jgi:hypothetical protein
VTQVPSTGAAPKEPAPGLCAPAARQYHSGTTGLQAWLLALVSQLEAARGQLDGREYRTLIDLAGRWLDSERDRLAQRPRLRIVQ